MPPPTNGFKITLVYDGAAGTRNVTVNVQDMQAALAQLHDFLDEFSDAFPDRNLAALTTLDLRVEFRR